MSPTRIQNPILLGADDIGWFDALPGEALAIRVPGELTGNAFSIAEAIIAPVAGPPLHIHHSFDEVIYVLEGTVDFVCGAERLRTGPGGMMVIPRGTPHSFRNFGDMPARLLGVFTPGGFEQMFVDMVGRPVSDMVELGEKYQLEIVGGPIDEVVAG